MGLAEKIKYFALNEAGFDLVGITRSELPPVYGEAAERWAEKGFAGSMHYMTRDAKGRANVAQIMPEARSVITLVLNYYHPEDLSPEGSFGKVAKYAYGRDYHKIIEKKLKRLSQFVLETGGKGTKARSYVDTGPVLERAFAKESGLGFFGKNTNIITREYGSFVFLASLITNLELESDSPHMGSCGSCRICIDACPTTALLGDYQIDATRCISYLTIESKEEPPAELKSKMGEWVFGCDICQDVCPYNHKAKTTREPDLYPNRIAGTWINLDEIAKIKDEAEFSKRFEGSPVKRAKKRLLGIFRTPSGQGQDDLSR